MLCSCDTKYMVATLITIWGRVMQTMVIILVDYEDWVVSEKSQSWFPLLHDKMTCNFKLFQSTFVSANTCYPYKKPSNVCVFVIAPILMEKEGLRRGQGLISVTKGEGHRVCTGTQGCSLLSEPDGKSQESAATFLAKIPLHLCSEHNAETS